MNKLLLIIATSCLLLGCAETRPNTSTDKSDVNLPQSNHKNVIYACSRNITLSVNFTYSSSINQQNLAIINGVGKQSIILPSKTVASGFLYTNGKYSLRGEGKQASWAVGRMAPFQCSVIDKALAQ